MERQVNPLFYIAEAGIVHDTPLWYVAYTYPRHEKAVSEQLQLRLVETFLPTYKHTSTWKDRRVKLDLPLFAGYVFTRVPARDRLKVMSVPGVIRMLSYRGRPLPVSDAEIDAIRMCFRSGAKLEPHRYITVGDRVQVREGLFEGLSGIVVRENNKCKLVVSVELIHQSVSLEIEPACLELVTPANMSGPEAIYESNARQGVGVS